jgi:hypothetical protein
VKAGEKYFSRCGACGALLECEWFEDEYGELVGGASSTRTTRHIRENGVCRDVEEVALSGVES